MSKMVPEEWMNDEYDGDKPFESVREGIYLALITMHMLRTQESVIDVFNPKSAQERVYVCCLEYLFSYAEWEKMGMMLTGDDEKWLLVKNYSADEDPDDPNAEWTAWRESITRDFTFDQLEH